MRKKTKPNCTLCSKKPDGRPPKKNTSQRAAIAARFKVLCLDAGLKVPDVARTLQVTERTVYAWFSGQTAVPYAAYKLLRILARFELPGWPGWHMHSGKLWTPEGFGFDPTDGAWWSLLVRQARGFRALYARANALEQALRLQGAERRPATKEVTTPVSGRRAEPGPSAPAEGRREAPALNLLKEHITTWGGAQTPSTEGELPFRAAISFIANIPYRGKGSIHGEGQTPAGGAATPASEGRREGAEQSCIASVEGQSGVRCS